MEKKILAIMVSLMVVAALVVAFVLIAAGGIRSAGGYTKLFDSLTYTGDATYNQYLEIPSDWNLGDTKTVSDTIVDMSYSRHTVAQTSIYITTLYFVYIGDQWTEPARGTSFFVPSDADYGGYMHIDHGQFSVTVSSATNLSHEYSIGGTITLETTIVDADGTVAFGEWAVAGIL
jgi:hypothetical protein